MSYDLCRLGIIAQLIEVSNILLCYRQDLDSRLWLRHLVRFFWIIIFTLDLFGKFFLLWKLYII